MDFVELKKMIADKVQMSDLLQESGIRLGTPGTEEQISCPFHGPDRSPSARHYPETNSIYCFTCKKSWDPVSFVMAKRGVRFKEAVNHLAKKAGIDPSGIWSNMRVSAGARIESKGKKVGLSVQDKMHMIRSEVTDSVLACRDTVTPKKYADMVYLTAHLNNIEEEADFMKLASPLLTATNKALNNKADTNG